MPVDLEKEKKKNIRLAIGVAAIGVFSFICMYVLMFALMFFKPGLLFSFMPFPSLSKDIASLNGKLYVISKEINMSDIAFEDHKKPEDKFMLGILEDKKITIIQEIKPFDSYAQAEDKIYFFSKGLYRTFDGARWEQKETDAIGKMPKGLVSPGGVFVLSEIKNNKALNVIRGDETIPLALPEEYAGDKKICTDSVDLVWAEGKLYFFWTSEGFLRVAAYDGNGWSVSEPSEHHGRIKVIADGKKIYMFSEHFSEQSPRITLTVYENSAWNEARDIDMPGLIIDWSPFIHEGKALLFARSFFGETIYTIENGKAVSPLKINRTFFGEGFLWKILQLILIGHVVLILAAYFLSLFVGKFKLKTWLVNSSEYEFASLFRRFLADTIDYFIIMLPPSIIFIGYFVNAPDSGIKLLKILLFVFLAAGYIIFGGFIYHWLLEGVYGKTLGKKICGIVILKDDFSRCTLLPSFLRNIMRIVDYFFYYLVGVISITGTLKWQRLGDIVAGTVVLRDKKSNLR